VGSEENSHNDSLGSRSGSRFWTRWIKSAARDVKLPANDSSPADDQVDIQDAVELLPQRLNSLSLPDGVIELVVDDFEASVRKLFDVRNGQVMIVEPGTAVPWASISGPPTAWAVALGPDCDVAGLELTGDQHLARRVLAAFPRHT
jgi:hypothetical protein